MRNVSLQVAAAVSAATFYAAIALAIKWWGYPGWTWRGYLSDMKTVVGLLAFGALTAAWLFRAYRLKEVDDAMRGQVRSLLRSNYLSPIVAVLSYYALLLLCILFFFAGERPIAPDVLSFAKQNQWQDAKDALATISKAPLRPELIETLDLYVSIHLRSDGDQVTDSKPLRELRSRVTRLLKSNADYESLNTLSFAEISKNVYFVERANEGRRSIDEGLAQINHRLAAVDSDDERARLALRSGELLLAAKAYEEAEAQLKEALDIPASPTTQSKIRANLGNALAAMKQPQRAALLYSQAEAFYPEGRLAVFYSNWGYLLMLSKEYPQAQRKIERALQIDSADWYSYLNLGLIKERLKQYEDAYSDFKVVIERSPFPDSRREARILAGRTLELGGHPQTEYVKLYLEADSRSTDPKQLARLLQDRDSLAAVYSAMARLLRLTNTHGIEEYTAWFDNRARAIGGR